MNCNQVCIDVCFPINLDVDTITAYSIGSYSATGVSLSAMDFVLAIPNMEVRENYNGVKQIVITKTEAELYSIEINQTNTVNNEPFIGGRPTTPKGTR